MKLGLAHEYFVAHGGAERVVETLHEMWPDAPVYTFFHDRARYGPLPGWNLRVSYLQRLLLGESHRLLLPLYPNAARALRVPPDTDVVLASTSGPVVHQTWQCAAGCWWQTYVVQPDGAVAEAIAVEAVHRALDVLGTTRLPAGAGAGSPPLSRSLKRSAERTERR